MVRKNPDSRMGPRYLANLQTFASLSYAENPNARAIIVALTKTPRTFAEARDAAGIPKGTFKEWWPRLKEDHAIVPADALEAGTPILESALRNLAGRLLDPRSRMKPREINYARRLGEKLGIPWLLTLAEERMTYEREKEEGG